MSRMMRNNKDHIDPRLSEKLELLRPTTPRDPEAAARGRARFLAELESMELPRQERNRKGLLAGWFFTRGKTKPAYAGGRKPRFAFSTAVMMITLFVFLFGGAGMTAMAAQSALPGDILYPVKTGIESVQMVLSTSAAERAELQMGFAEQRLDEILGLVEGGQFDQIPPTTDSFEAHIRQVMVEVEDIRNQDPQGAAEISDRVSSAFARYGLNLSKMMEQLPEEIQVKVMHTIQNTWLAGNLGEISFNGTIEDMGTQAWVIAGQAIAIHAETEVKGTFAIGDVVQVRAIRNADGSLAALHIVRAMAGLEDGEPGGADQPSGAAGDPGAGPGAGEPGEGGLNGDPSHDPAQNVNQGSGTNGGQTQPQTPGHQGPANGSSSDQDAYQKQTQDAAGNK